MSAWAYLKSTPANPHFIAHHGIKGQKWGIRRFQNEDGSLTAEGMARYGINSKDPNRTGDLKTRTKALRKASRQAHQTLRYNDYEGNTPEYQLIDNALKEVYGEDAYKNYEKQNKRRTMAAIAAVVAATSAAYLIGEKSIEANKRKKELQAEIEEHDKMIEELDKAREVQKEENKKRIKEYFNNTFNKKEDKSESESESSGYTDEQWKNHKLLRQYGPQLYVTDDMYENMTDEDKSWFKKDRFGNYNYDRDRHYGI